MSYDKEKTTNIQNRSDEQFNLRHLIGVLWEKRSVFLVSLLFALTVALLYVSFARPVYRAHMTVFIKDESRSYFRNARNDLLQGFGLFSGIKNMQNEMVILQSYSVMYETLRRLDLQVSYYGSTALERERELYGIAPFSVIMDSSHLQLPTAFFDLANLDSGKLSISCSVKKAWTFDYRTKHYVKKLKDYDFEQSVNWGKWIESPYFRFKLVLNDNQQWTDKQLSEYAFGFRFNTIEDLTLKAQKSLVVTIVNKQASVVRLSMETYNMQKAKDVLNTLSKVYLERGLKKKNKIAINTIYYIDSQLQEIRDSLTRNEDRLQLFKQQKRLLDLPFQAQIGLERLQKLEEKRIQFRLKQKYLTYIVGQMTSAESTELILPAAMDNEMPLINDLIIEFTRLQNQSRTFTDAGPQNPFVLEQQRKLKSTKEILLQAVRNEKAKQQQAKVSLDVQLRKIEKELLKLPQKQRQLIELERMFTLNSQLYTFLLKKRAEAQIAKASNTSDNEIIDIARQWGRKPIRPKKEIVFLLAVFLGVIVPVGLLVFLDYLDDSVSNKKDILQLTSMPVVATIARSNLPKKTVILDYPKSSTAESFRSLRTNLQFYGHGEDKLTILVTSSLAGEGKTFTAMNLALTYAAYGKTVLVGFDLRRPRIYDDFGLNNEVGVSNVLIGRAKLEDVVQATKVEWLDVVSSGPIPPNPVELIGSEQAKHFVELLKENYDYVIMDTAPVGLVTDAFLLMKYADSNLYMVRQNYTKRQDLRLILDDLKQKNIKNVSLVLNDVSTSGYGYRYGYTYYEDAEPKGMLGRLIRRKNNKI